MCLLTACNFKQKKMPRHYVLYTELRDQSISYATDQYGYLPYVLGTDTANESINPILFMLKTSKPESSVQALTRTIDIGNQCINILNTNAEAQKYLLKTPADGSMLDIATLYTNEKLQECSIWIQDGFVRRYLRIVREGKYEDRYVAFLGSFEDVNKKIQDGCASELFGELYELQYLDSIEIPPPPDTSITAMFKSLFHLLFAF